LADQRDPKILGKPRKAAAAIPIIQEIATSYVVLKELETETQANCESKRND
jgi:hypothetical protein